MKHFLKRPQWGKSDYYALGLTVLFLVLWVFDFDSLHLNRVLECLE